MGGERGQSAIIGVAVLLLLTVTAIGGLTTVLGASVTGGIALAELQAVGGTLDAVTAPTDDPGLRSMTMRVGTLETYPLRLEVVGAHGTIDREVGAVRYRAGGHRLSCEFGARIRTVEGEVVAVTSHRIRRAGDRIYVGVPSIHMGDVDTIAAGGRAVRVGLQPEVVTDHRWLPPARYTLRLETHHPSVWVPILEEVGARVHTDTRARAPHMVTAVFDEPVGIDLVTQTVDLEVV
jgi:flagellin-like protein